MRMALVAVNRLAATVVQMAVDAAAEGINAAGLWPRPTGPATAWLVRGSHRTCPLRAAGLSSKPGAPVARKCGSGWHQTAECTGRPPACPAACRGWGWKSRVLCSRRHNRGGSSQADLHAMKINTLE
jgi:hypothetical protein